ncbi:MAG TPA: hypothetical protein PKC30_09540 [Saprospiraceae bacterium]|nr:hypothetical protein [Saprospiraceae bacterium]
MTWICIAGLFHSCTYRENRAIEIIDKAIELHGGDGYKEKVISFDFRQFHLKVKYSTDSFRYERSYTDTTGRVKEVYAHNEISRTINGVIQDLDSSFQSRMSNGIHAMIYFTMLPYRLRDDAVIARYLGEERIKDKTYHKIRVTFQEEGGGKDHEDIFLYWFGTEDHFMDFLAYEYYTDGGGRRFREVISRRNVGGITFQDYNNYSEKIDEPFESIASRFENGALQLLSVVDLKHISVSVTD